MIYIIPVKKNDEYTLEITAVSSDGNGISHIDGYTIFVPDTVTGDIVKILILKTKASYGYGKILEIITPSPYRILPICNKATQCGGCCFSHIDYNKQLNLKKEFVESAFSRIGGFSDFKVSKILGMDHPERYRNKMVFPFGLDSKGDIQFGFFKERSHDIIPLDDCILGDKINFKILNIIKKHMVENNIFPYDETSHKGSVRRVFIRKSYHTSEIMVVISSNTRTIKNIDVLTNRIKSISNDIVSIILNINTQKNNLVLGNENVILFGKTSIHDKLCGLDYEISPNSFFQINPTQTEKLYKTAIDFADISTNDIVLDVYCGIGTISLAAARLAKKVIGVEIVPQAIENAKKNAIDNNILNSEFLASDAQTAVPGLIKKGLKPDIVILDPPRKGSDVDTLSAIISAEPSKIVYVSCNPSTLARDVRFLNDNGYIPLKAVAVDMFPHTHHVEAVTLLTRNEKTR